MGPTKCCLHAGRAWEGKRKPIASGPHVESSTVASAWISLLHNRIFFKLLLNAFFSTCTSIGTGTREKVRLKCGDVQRRVMNARMG